MCGIIAYVGNRDAMPILVKGLNRLEYRGYDSSGIAILNGSIQVHKTIGRIQDLESIIPKHIDINTITQEVLDDAADILNNLPRKILGYKTPNEVWNENL